MLNHKASDFIPKTKINQSITHLSKLSDSEHDSDDDYDSICDKLNEIKSNFIEDEKNLIIQKQIEDDLLTHDFSKPHVTREEIQKILGMKVKNIMYYQRSLVHKSIYKAVKRYNGTEPLQEYLNQHNERLEFLGDSVLGFIIANYLFNKYPDQNEGFLTRVKTKLVNGSQLSKLAKQINLGDYILMSNHVQNIKGRHSQNILEDAFEAFLAAIFKDLGFEAVNSFVVNLINTLDFTEVLLEDNYKDLLLKYTQINYKKCNPEYSIVKTEGPPHNRTFTVVVIIDNKEYEQATAKSKKQAEQTAAEKTLKKLKELIN
jgi:ribonuclease-3